MDTGPVGDGRRVGRVSGGSPGGSPTGDGPGGSPGAGYVGDSTGDNPTGRSPGTGSVSDSTGDNPTGRSPGAGSTGDPGGDSGGTRPVRVSARERIRTTAFALFYAHGPRGVGVDRIIADSGVAKATFYKHFPRKDDLVLAYLDHVDRIWFGQLRAAAEAAGEGARDQLVGMFDALASACRRDGYHGCAFINTAAESEPGTDVHTRTVAHKQQVRDWVVELSGRAGAAEPVQLARQLTLLLDGGLSAGVLDADPQAARAAKAAARVIVEAAARPAT